MALRLVANAEAMADLGESGLALAESRLTDYLSECPTCGRALAEAPVTVATRTFPGGYVLVRAHHERCPIPDGFSTTYLVSPMMMGGMPLLLIHPSVEVVWLRQQTSGKRNRRSWEDTTTAGLIELGFQQGIAGAELPLRPVPGATVQCIGRVVTIDVPPVHRWSVEADPAVVSAIREHGQVAVVVSNGTDQHDLNMDKLNAVFTAGDYVAGIADHAPLGQARIRANHGQLRHPIFLVAVPTVNARTVYLDDPEVGWAAVLVGIRDAPQLAGVDADRVPVALLESPASIHIGRGDSDYLVDLMVAFGLTRLSPTTMRLAPTQGWQMHYRPGRLELRAPSGMVVVANVTPDPQWLSTALGHRHVLALFGPVLGVRDVEEEGTRPFEAPQRRQELNTAVASGLVAGGMVSFNRDTTT